MAQTRIYPGIHDDKYGGMTDIGKLIRDAWVFDLLPETETCVNWNYAQLEMLYDKVHKAWSEYGHRVSHLPPALQERHAKIHRQAFDLAKEQGWNPDLGDEQ